MKKTRPALRYFGSKFRLSKWIIRQIPDHVCYVEPFGGGMGVLLNKEPSMFEVYNDIDGEVVNFFQVLRDYPDELIRAIELTPYSREEQLTAIQRNDEELQNFSEIERARRLYTASWQSHGGGRSQWNAGWRYQFSKTRVVSIVDDWNKTSHLHALARRLKQVQIERDDAIRVINRFDGPDTLFYVDPPYLQETRSTRWKNKAYRFEVDDEYHQQLAMLLNSIQGMAIISGYPSETYEAYYCEWKKLQKASQTDFNNSSTECIWVSPNTIHRQNQLQFDLSVRAKDKRPWEE